MLLVIGFSIYSVIDQAVTLTYIRDGFNATENDLDNLTKIINETDLTKIEIQKALSKHKLYEYMDFNSDTVSLDRVSLMFKGNKLFQITKPCLK